MSAEEGREEQLDGGGSFGRRPENEEAKCSWGHRGEKWIARPSTSRDGCPTGDRVTAMKIEATSSAGVATPSTRQCAGACPQAWGHSEISGKAQSGSPLSQAAPGPPGLTTCCVQHGGGATRARALEGAPVAFVHINSSALSRTAGVLCQPCAAKTEGTSALCQPEGAILLTFDINLSGQLSALDAAQ